MHTQPVRTIVGSILAALLVLVPAAAAVAQESKSASAAREFVQLMQAQKLDSMAARQAAPDQFVAALVFPGQLLVVWAKYSAPALLVEKIAQGNFRDVYIDLNSASVANSKFLITDLGADGLKARREDDQPFDAQDANGKTVQFDGNWREDKMSEEEYMKAFASADEAYAQALAVLLGVMKKG